MAENYKHLYEQTKKMLTMYQDELIPGFRKKIEELEKRKPAPKLMPMGALTYAIACSHCRNRGSNKCDKCKREVESGFELATDNNAGSKWIPVTDRVPEESGMYIVAANDGHAQRVSFVLWQKKNRMWNLTGARSYWRVTHWQPMPQPPKGE